MKVLILKDCVLNKKLGYSNLKFIKGLVVKLPYDVSFFLIREGKAKEVK